MSSSPERRSDTDGGPCRVRIAGTDLQFAVGPGERILGAAHRAGVWLPFECGWGSCGTCKVTLLEGEVELLYPDAPAVDPRDARRRRALICQTTARSDLVVKVLRTGPTEERPTRDHRAELLAAEQLGPDIGRFRFRLDTAGVYRPGQYAVVELGRDVRRCYSMAGPAGSDTVEFIAKRYPGGAGSGALFALEPGERVLLELPYGDMWLRSGVRDVVLTAGGTGLSPVLALLRQLAAAGDPRRIHVFYGANTEEELVCWEELQALVARLPAARLHGALAKPTRPWAGTTGLVTDALAPRLDELAEADHYLAGPPVMVDAVLALLRAGGTPIDRIHYDRFADEEVRREQGAGPGDRPIPHRGDLVTNYHDVGVGAAGTAPARLWPGVCVGVAHPGVGDPEQNLGALGVGVGELHLGQDGVALGYRERAHGIYRWRRWWMCRVEVRRPAGGQTIRWPPAGYGGSGQTSAGSGALSNSNPR